MPKSVGIIGAGPGGLAAACLLRREGFDVEVFELRPTPGGRNSKIEINGFRFDTGPTFFLMPQVLEGIFQRCGKALSEYVRMHRIDPLYKLDFGEGGQLWPSSDPKKMSAELAKNSSRDGETFWAFRNRQKEKFEAIFPALKNSAEKFMDLARLENFSALPFLDLRSVYNELSEYFEDERNRLAFTFQAKYLGMSPFECPSLFSILPHIEHDQGVWHPEGGCAAVCEGLAKLFLDLGGVIHYSTPVSRVKTDSGLVTGFELESGQTRGFDYYVLNADFAHGMKNLFSDTERVKFKNRKLESLKYSCSTFMLYLGLSKKLDWPHHAIYFSPNYRRNLRELCETFEVSMDPSFYIHNPSNLDKSLAPEGKAALYILVPAPQLHPSRSWNWSDLKTGYRDRVLAKIEERCGVDLKPLIECEKIITPEDWESEYRVFRGATFSLAHTPDQLMQFRPHNQNEDFSNLYIVGGGTHPGSGLPTIFQSGILAADKIKEHQNRSKILPLPSVRQARVAFEEIKRMGSGVTQNLQTSIPQLAQSLSAQVTAQVAEQVKIENLNNVVQNGWGAAVAALGNLQTQVLNKIKTKGNKSYGQEIDIP